MKACIAPHYRQLAQECLDVAERNPKDREELQHIAEIWLSLATQELAQASRNQRASRRNWT